MEKGIAQKYSVNDSPVEALLGFIRVGDMVVPDIQRPFVWSGAKVRDFIDSLYHGYPVGYLICWRNPDVRLKDGTVAHGKRILIDGQQRITALGSALLGNTVVDKHYRQIRIAIAFHPEQQIFEVANPAIRNDRAWIPDISTIRRKGLIELVRNYRTSNPNADESGVENSLDRLRLLENNPIGLIELNADLDIKTVTEIFIRINSKGVVLSQSDFAMSKIAASEQYGGHLLRKCIDYFCHLAAAPEAYNELKGQDKNFADTDYFSKMAWLRNERDDLYDPSYTDMLRVAFTSEFKRGRLEDLVALLSGRNFETLSYEESIAEDSFKKLNDGILNFMSETNFQRFLMIIKSAGFVHSSMIRSRVALNFAYILFLTLREKGIPPNQIESLVKKWFVMSILTGRYSGSVETRIDEDIRRITQHGEAERLAELERAELSAAFWEAGLPQNMETSSATSPSFKVFLAAQVHAADKGFLSRIAVRDLIVNRGDVHHIFPRNYLKNQGVTRSDYNQIANYAMMQNETNITIGDKPPAEYFSELQAGCRENRTTYGGISDIDELSGNFETHCIPKGIEKMTWEDYDSFLKKRRDMMAVKIRDYYNNL